jgi:hypothetical protein
MRTFLGFACRRRARAEPARKRGVKLRLLPDGCGKEEI